MVLNGELTRTPDPDPAASRSLREVPGEHLRLNLQRRLYRRIRLPYLLSRQDCLPHGEEKNGTDDF